MNIIKKLRRLLSRHFPEYILKRKGITTHNCRHLRLEVLAEQSHRLARLMKTMDYPAEIVISRDTVKVIASGVILDTKFTNRYFKVTGKGQANEGESMLEMLQSKGIKPQTILDIGANFGEISLYFLRHVPEARVIAVEASPENLAVLHDNIESQLYDVSNLTVVPEAISDQVGTVEITTGCGSENSIMAVPDDSAANSDFRRVKIPATTLDKLIKINKINHIDFMKVDIEGAEPLLLEDIKKNASMISALYIEFSNKNNKKNYLNLLRMLYQSGFQCLSPENNEVYLTHKEAKNICSASLDMELAGTDYWFFKSSAAS